MTRVIIVEDHEAVRVALGDLLRDRGFEIVGGAGNAAAARDLVAQCDPDGAVVDVGLPDGDGIDLTRDLLAHRPGLAVLIYTGQADAALLAGGLDSGARGYALKSGSVEELIGAIERVAAGESHVDPRLDGVVLPERSTARGPGSRPASGR